MQKYKNIISILLLIIVSACSSTDRKLYLDGGGLDSADKCGVESFVNRYASYRCSTLELENNNEYVNQSTPLHNIKDVIIKNNQRLLVVAEKIFGAHLREKDQEVVCTRRLKVILNPGSGSGPAYQEGWLTYRPSCLKFFRVKSSSYGEDSAKYISRTLYN